MTAARDVDDAGTSFQKRKGSLVENPARLRRERQQAHQCIAHLRDRIEIRRAGNTLQLLRPAAETRHLEAEREELARGVGSELAQAEEADAAVGGQILAV